MTIFSRIMPAFTARPIRSWRKPVTSSITLA